MLVSLLLINNYRTKYANPQIMPLITPQERKVALYLTIAWVLIELVFFIWALYLAFKCGGRRGGTLLHVLVAFFFPIIYVLYYFLSGCGRSRSSRR